MRHLIVLAALGLSVFPTKVVADTRSYVSGSKGGLKGEGASDILPARLLDRGAGQSLGKRLTESVMPVMELRSESFSSVTIAPDISLGKKPTIGVTFQMRW